MEPGKTLAAAFPVALPYQTTVPGFRLWGFHLAINGPDVPAIGNVAVDTDFGTAETAGAVLAFGKDISRATNTIVNSIFGLKLSQLYLKDMRRRKRV